jgi:uncharacterized protein (TIGR02145 family)
MAECGAAPTPPHPAKSISTNTGNNNNNNQSNNNNNNNNNQPNNNNDQNSDAASDNTPRTNLPEGAACQKTEECSDTLICLDSTCQNKLIINEDGQPNGATCSRGSECVSGLCQGAKCVCPTGFTGDRCDTCERDYFGKNCKKCSTCVNGGCDDGVRGSGACMCVSGFTGPTCEKCVKGNYGAHCVKCTKVGDTYQGAANASDCSYADNRSENNPVTYKVVTIGEQIWMAENIRYKAPGANGTGINGQSVEGDPTKDEIYGLIYTFDEAKKVCPSGWRLPNNNDFKELLTFAGAENEEDENEQIFLDLIEKSDRWVHHQNRGTDKYGFSLRPAGYREDLGVGKTDLDKGVNAYLWSSTVESDLIIKYYCLDAGQNKYGEENVGRAILHSIANHNEGDRRSVRCIYKQD